MEYREFVSRVVSCVEPLVADGRNVLRMFCGAEVIDLGALPFGVSPVVLPSTDFARVYGKRAELFSDVGMGIVDIVGVSESAYACQHSKSTGEAYMDVSCYARNVRRWMGGQLPRKIKARADFCIAATCWAFGWSMTGDCDGFEADAVFSCRARLLEVAGELLDGREGIPAPEAASPYDLARVLWLASMRAYRNSLDARAGSSS